MQKNRADKSKEGPLQLSQVRYGKGPVLKIEQNLWNSPEWQQIIDTKFGMVTHTVNSNLKPLLFFKKVTWLSILGVKTIQIWPQNFGPKRQSEGYLLNLQKMALTAWDRV